MIWWLMNSEPLSQSMPVTANGTASTNASKAASTCTRALFRMGWVYTQPVCTQVKFTLLANSPFRVGPQWATVSTSKNPGSPSTSSPALRTWIDWRSRCPGLVLVLPRIGSRALAGAR